MKKPEQLRNVKDLFANLLETIEKLQNHEITLEEAQTTARLHHLALGYLVYEIKREKIERKLRMIEVKELPE